MDIDILLTSGSNVNESLHLCPKLDIFSLVIKFEQQQKVYLILITCFITTTLDIILCFFDMIRSFSEWFITVRVLLYVNPRQFEQFYYSYTRENIKTNMKTTTLIGKMPIYLANL